jgi:hypothetical protein
MKFPTQLTRWCSCTLLMTLLAACGGGSDSAPLVVPTTTLPTTAAQCYQLTNGNSFRNSDNLSITRDITIQAATYNGVAVQSRVSSISNAGTLTLAPDKFETFSTITVDGKYNRLAARHTSSTGDISEAVFSGFLRSLNLAVGQTETYTYTVSSPEGASIGKLEHTLQLLAIEDVVTAAGTFKNACKFSLVDNAPGDQPPVGFSDIFWYAPGWGNVKEIVEFPYTPGGVYVPTITAEAILILKGTL